jgi:hypothetical protein
MISKHTSTKLNKENIEIVIEIGEYGLEMSIPR